MLDALNSGQVGGYGTDVLDVEPPPADHPLLTAPNTVITPHIGSRTYESVERQATMAAKNLILGSRVKNHWHRQTKLPCQHICDIKKMTNEEQFYIVPSETHNELVKRAYQHRGFDESECEAAAKFSAYATTHGIRTHNALKALHLDDLFGSKAGGCKPSAQILKKESRFESSEVWDCQFKLGQATAYEAMDRCIELADKYGIGQVSVDHAFHYLWGGGYVMDAAKRGYIAYTNCTASITEVVPFMGSVPTLGTNPHSWGVPHNECSWFPYRHRLGNISDRHG